MKYAFLFPGQGAQAVGMAGELCKASANAAELFRQASAILGYDLLDACVNGPGERLNATDVSQPAIYVASMAALELVHSAEPDADAHVVATAGLSLGEYTALTFAGALSFDDGVRIVKARGEAMQAAATATPSGMVSIIGMDVGEVESLAAEAREAGTIEVANLLCPGNTVVSGTAAAIAKLNEIGTGRGIRTIPLAVAGAFHTAIMKPADHALEAVLASVTLRSPRIPIWSNVDAKPHTDPAEIKALLVKQILSPVQWESTMRGLVDLGIDRYYEIGPGRVLAGLLKRVNRKLEIKNYTA
jgi:[acyl-carrier-protein] S-malonyltransferase